MPIPETQPLILPVLRHLADGAERPSVQIKKAIAEQFKLTPEELAQKQRGNSTTFENHVAWPLAWLNQVKAIVKVRKGIYRIADHGKVILEACKDRQEITLKELRAF